MVDLIIPMLIAFVMIYALIKGVDAYNGFVKGAKGALPLMASLLPYMIAMFVAVELFRNSGLSTYLCRFLAPVFEFIGVPAELCELTLIRPFSSNAGYVVLRGIFDTYGVDSYIGKCASVIMGSSDTIFYVSSIYFASTKVKKTLLTIPIALLCNVACCVLACFCCRFI
ncbi:MAG: spore maturation protein [Clostridiales bacterium]|nr:spore maturation protein [Clostridiales bacterium]